MRVFFFVVAAPAALALVVVLWDVIRKELRWRLRLDRADSLADDDDLDGLVAFETYEALVPPIGAGQSIEVSGVQRSVVRALVLCRTLRDGDSYVANEVGFDRFRITRIARRRQ